MITTDETMQLRGCAGLLAKRADETLTIYQIWKKAKWPCCFKYAKKLIEKHNLPHKKETEELKGCARSLAKVADETLTIKEIWEKAGKYYSLSYVYITMRLNKFPYKKKEWKKPPFKYLEQIKCLQTQNLTIREIMGLLGLSTHNDYCCIHQALVKNNLPFKRNTKRKDRKLNYETNLHGEKK